MSEPKIETLRQQFRRATVVSALSMGTPATCHDCGERFEPALYGLAVSEADGVTTESVMRFAMGTCGGCGRIYREVPHWT